ncbi:hypothetical protein [Blattabacterium cuenoti]|uniref:hypothetical protein n=1 Tax=Blattabacterium cuenoti TaxID=1653831 RepID=UPI001EE9D4A3|nr:hypothetical protein [Blattabacterium cuenoti]
MDNFLNTRGIHAFSITLSAFLRLNFLKFFDGNNFIIKKNDFSIYDLPLIKKIFYTFSLVIIHNISLLILGIFRNPNFFNSIVLLKTIFSSIFTTVLCIIYFFFRRIKH